MQEALQIAQIAALKAGAAIMEIYKTADFGVEMKSDDSPLTLADKKAHEIIAADLEHTGIPILSEEGRSIPYAERKLWDHFWMVDPLDGTKEFIKRNGEFTVNIALMEKSESGEQWSPVYGIVYAPALEQLYVGMVGSGSFLYKGGSNQAIEIPHPQFLKEEVYTIVASRSHLSEETQAYIDTIQTDLPKKTLSKGSSLKLCMIATGEANEYPRLGPTMEWDIAAAHAVVKAAGKNVTKFEPDKSGALSNDSDQAAQEMTYNKEDLLNPWFICK